MARGRLNLYRKAPNDDRAFVLSVDTPSEDLNSRLPHDS